MARGASGGAKVRSCKEMEERDVVEYMARAQAQGAMQVPACLGAVGVAGNKLGIPRLMAGGAQTANEFSKYVHGVMMVALHKIAKPVAADGVCNIVTLQCVVWVALRSYMLQECRQVAHTQT
jgi:hypothetical protein